MHFFNHIKNEDDILSFFKQYNINENSYIETLPSEDMDIIGQSLIYNDQHIIDFLYNINPNVFNQYLTLFEANYHFSSDNIKFEPLISSYKIHDSYGFSFERFYDLTKSLHFLYLKTNDSIYLEKMNIAFSQRIDESGVMYSSNYNGDYVYLEKSLAYLKNNLSEDEFSFINLEIDQKFFSQVFKDITSKDNILSLNRICEYINQDFLSYNISAIGFYESPFYLDFFIEKKGINSFLSFFSNEQNDYNHDYNLFYKSIIEKNNFQDCNSLGCFQHKIEFLKVLDKHDVLKDIPSKYKTIPNSIINSEFSFSDEYYSFFKKLATEYHFFINQVELSNIISSRNRTGNIYDILHNITDHYQNNEYLINYEMTLLLTRTHAKTYDSEYLEDFLIKIKEPHVYLKKIIESLAKSTFSSLNEEQSLFVSTITQAKFLNIFDTDISDISFSQGQASSIIQKNIINNNIIQINEDDNLLKKRRL